MKSQSLIQKTLLYFLFCTAVIFVLMTPLFYLVTKHFYSEDLIDVIQSVNRGNGIPPINLEEDIMQGVMLQFTIIFTIIFAILSIAMLITVRFITHRLWQPFDDALKKAERFNLAQSEIPQFAATDISEFTRLNDSLSKLMRKNIDAYKIQKEFTENASHELQTPLAITRCKLDLLLQEKLSKQQLDIVTELYQLNSRIRHLNRNLLLLAKIDNSQYNQLEPISLIDFINKLLPSYKHLTCHCNLIFNHSEPTTILQANPILLECLLNNIVVNAIRNTKSGDIYIDICNGKLCINNPAEGLPLNSDEIFQRFHATNTSNGGNGLGLAIVKAICDFHNWDIEYSSENKRHCFTISFK